MTNNTNDDQVGANNDEQVIMSIYISLLMPPTLLECNYVERHLQSSKKKV